MDGKRTVRESLEANQEGRERGRERERKKRSRMRRMEGVELDMRLVDVKIENKCFGGNTMGICREEK
jgi:hypothetical protein